MSYLRFLDIVHDQTLNHTVTNAMLIRNFKFSNVISNKILYKKYHDVNLNLTKKGIEGTVLNLKSTHLSISHNIGIIYKFFIKKIMSIKLLNFPVKELIIIKILCTCSSYKIRKVEISNQS